MAAKSLDARAAARILKAWGWEVGARPTPKKFVAIAAPHTSNTDGLLMILMSRVMDLELSFMIKSDWNKPLVGPLVRHYGAVFINRARASGVVDEMIEEFERRDEMCLLIPPEGTRSRAEYWKSGFYHIALGAKVPVVPGFLDYKRKKGGFGEPLVLTGDVKADMDALRAFYAAGDYGPARPADFGPVRLREEDAAK